MATWEDGPEYAPIQRPHAFAEPQAAPLETPAPTGVLIATRADLPPVAPQFRPADQPGPPLDRLRPAETDRRNPTEPFQLASAALTGVDAGVDPSWAPPGGAPVGGAPVGGAAPPVPAGRRPTDPFRLSGTADPTAGFAAPGTVGWFAPPPPDARPVNAPPPVSIPAALTPAYLTMLLITLVVPVAPFVLVISVFLSGRATVARRTVRLVAGLGLVAWIIAMIVCLAVAQTGGGRYWATCVAATIVAVLTFLIDIVVVTRPGAPRQPPPAPRWGG